MRTFLAVAFLSGGVAHATLGPALRIADVAPDIPLIVVVMLALRHAGEAAERIRVQAICLCRGARARHVTRLNAGWPQ